MTYCCSAFRDLAGESVPLDVVARLRSAPPAMMLGPFIRRHSPVLEQQSDRTWALVHPCDDVYIAEGIRFCPFCGCGVDIEL